MPTPLPWCGVINTHSTICVCTSRNRAGLGTEQLLLNNAGIFLNAGTNTQFSTVTGVFSAIYVFICSPILVLRLSVPDLQGSDYFSMDTTTDMSSTVTNLPKDGA